MAKVLDLIEDGVCYYVIMEFVRGRDLFDYFVQDKVYEKPYKLQIVTQIWRDLIGGLLELHQTGMIHKDIKLENVVLDESKRKQEGENR